MNNPLPIFNNLDKMDQFFKTYTTKILRRNKFCLLKKLHLKLKTFQQRKLQAQMVSLLNSTTHLWNK